MARKRDGGWVLCILGRTRIRLLIAKNTMIPKTKVQAPSSEKSGVKKEAADEVLSRHLEERTLRQDPEKKNDKRRKGSRIRNKTRKSEESGGSIHKAASPLPDTVGEKKGAREKKNHSSASFASKANLFTL